MLRYNAIKRLLLLVLQPVTSPLTDKYRFDHHLEFQMPFSDLPEHLLMPALRQFHPFGVQKEGKPYVGLRDPFMLVKETIVIPAKALSVIQRIDGESSAEEIANTTGAPPDRIVDLLQRLDSVGLLWGPTLRAI